MNLMRVASVRIRRLLGLLSLTIVALLATTQPATAQRAAAQQAAPNQLIFEAAIKGSKAGELRWPVSVAAASTVEIAVADAFGSRLVIFAAGGGDWTVKHVVSLSAPPLAVAWVGRRYVVALRRDLVAIEGPDFVERTLSLPAGTVPGTIAAAADGGLLIHDVTAGRVLALDEDGNLGHETAAQMTPLDGHLTGLAAAVGGGFYGAFGDLAEVRRYDPEGQLLATWRVPGLAPAPAWPAGLMAEPSGEIVLVDRHAGRLVVLDPAGQWVGTGGGKGWNAGRLMFPAAIARLPDGRLAVVDQGNGRVQIFRRVEQGSGP